MIETVVKSMIQTGSVYVPHKLFRSVTAHLDNSHPELKYRVSVDKKRYYTISLGVND